MKVSRELKWGLGVGGGGKEPAPFISKSHQAVSTIPISEIQKKIIQYLNSYHFLNHFFCIFGALCSLDITTMMAANPITGNNLWSLVFGKKVHV